MSPKVTIYDLAKRLNTSPSTVSRALQDHPRISQSMRHAVQQAAIEMNYQPDSIAAHLRTGKGSVIGVVVPRIDRHFFASIIGGIEQVARENGYSVLVCQTHERYSDEKAVIKALLAKKIDGLAISLTGETSEYRHLLSVQNRRVPLVFFDRVPTALFANQIQVDNFGAAYQATSHLIEQGCRRIAHFAGPQALSSYKDRCSGYLQALRDCNITPDPQLIIADCITTQAGERAAQLLMQMDQRPDGVFSAGDFSAAGAMQVFKKSGWSIPQDIAFVGFANEPFCSLMEPALSSIDLDNEYLGNQTANLLFEQISEENNSEISLQNVVTETNLIIRGSSLRNH